MNNKQLTGKTLFISRKLDNSSIFLQLSSSGWTIIDQSLLNIKYLPIDHIPISDWIFFYSPNAVRAFTENADRLKFSVDSVKIAAYGSGTADVVLSSGLPVEFTGTGEHEGTLQTFNVIASGSTVLFPRALNSKNAMISHGVHDFNPIDLIIYENTVKPVAVPDCQIYIFTSSMNVTSFFVKNRIPAGSKVIAIGAPTATTLLEYYNGKIFTPTEPTESELYNLMTSLNSDITRT